VPLLRRSPAKPAIRPLIGIRSAIRRIKLGDEPMVGRPAHARRLTSTVSRIAAEAPK
jgi:hypothetical protein